MKRKQDVSQNVVLGSIKTGLSRFCYKFFVCGYNSVQATGTGQMTDIDI